ncbi:MAG: ABC transporter substrate-binding protein, partial [Deltaproteobacteria bacterium]|nr:ABC transporter substrate-binding protein [Deltaproteobacteria bacterium]
MRSRHHILARTLGLALAAGAAAALLAAGSLPAQEGKDPATGEAYPEVFNIATFNSALGTAIPIQEKWFEGLVPGVKSNVVYFDTGRDTNTAFASKSIDAANFGSSPASLGISNGLGYEVIFINDIIGPAESLAVTEKSGVRSLRDLKGKKVATPFASTAHYSLLSALVLEGVDPSEVQIIDLPTQDILAAWIRGDIDGAYVWTPVLDELLKNGGTAITDSLKLAERGIVTADITVVSKEFAAKYPTLVTTFVKALVRTNDLINDDLHRASQIAGLNIGISTEEARSQFAGFGWPRGRDQLSPRYLGTRGAPGDFAKTLLETSKFHVTQNNLDRAGDLSLYEAAVNGGFIEDALKYGAPALPRRPRDPGLRPTTRAGPGRARRPARISQGPRARRGTRETAIPQGRRRRPHGPGPGAAPRPALRGHRRAHQLRGRLGRLRQGEVQIRRGGGRDLQRLPRRVRLRHGPLRLREEH